MVKGERRNMVTKEKQEDRDMSQRRKMSCATFVNGNKMYVYIRKFSSLSHTLLSPYQFMLPTKAEKILETHHPACLDKAADLTNGVLIHGFDICPSPISFVIGVVEPILYCSVFISVFELYLESLLERIYW